MDRTVLTLAVDSTQVGTAAAAFDRMVNAGNAAAASAGRVTSATLAEGRTIAQTLVPALNRSVAGTRALADSQAALSRDATRQAVQQTAAVRDRAVAPSFAPAAAPVPQSVVTGQAAPVTVPRVLAEGADSAQAAIDRLTASARANRVAVAQLAPSAEATARSFRQLSSTPITIAQPQGLSAVAATLGAAQRVNAAPVNQLAAAWAAASVQASRASTSMAQANRVIGAMPRGLVTSAAPSARNPLAAQPIISAASRQVVPTISAGPTSQLAAEAGRAQSAVERLTNAARDQRSALAQLAPAATTAAMSYRQLSSAPMRNDAAAQIMATAGALANVTTQATAARRAVADLNRTQPSNNRQPVPANQNFGQTSPAQLQQLGFQINDFFVQIASGQSVLTALIQQGSQLSGTFGGIRPAFQAVLSLLTPIRLAAGGAATAIGALALAYSQAARDSKAFKDAAILSGNFAGKTEGQFNALATAVADRTQATVGSAREIAQALLATGQIGPQAFDRATEAATRFSAAYKKTAEETAGIFAKLAEDPSKFAAELNKTMGLFSAVELEAITKLQEGGAATEAQIAILDKLNDRLRKLDGNLDIVDRALNKSRKAFSDWWAEVKGDVGDMFGLTTLQRQLRDVNAEIEKAKSGGSGGFSSTKFSMTSVASSNLPALEARRKKLLDQQKAEDDAAKKEAEKQEINKQATEGNAVVKALIKRAKPEVEYKERLAELERSFKAAEKGGITVSAEDQKAARAQLKKDFTPAKTRGGNEASQVLREQLQSDIRGIDDAFQKQRDAFEFQSTFVEAAYRNGNVSLQTLMDQRRQSIERSAQAEIAALDQERSRLQQYQKQIKDPSERAQTQTRINEIDVEKERVELRAQRDVVLVNEEEASSYRQLSEQVVAYRANLLQLQGDEAGAAALRAQSVIANARQLAAQTGDASVDVSALERAIALTDQFNEVQRQASLLAGNSARAEEAFALAAERQGKSLLETERGIYEIRVQELDQLGALAQKARELAEASTDPRIKAFAADLALEYAKAADAIDPALNRLRDASRQLAAGLANTAGFAPRAFIQEYAQQRNDVGDEVRREREVYTRRIEMLEGYLATTQDKNDKARLRERIKQEEGKRDGLKGESRGSSALKAINEAVVQPMAEQVFNTVNKLLITDPLQAYLEGQLKSLTEGDGMLAGFFKDALGIKADPKQLAQQQQTAAITASSNALDVLTSAAQNAANALNSRSPGSAVVAGAGNQLAPRGDGYALREPVPVDVDLSGASEETVESVSQFGAETLKTTSDLVQLANAANIGGSAMTRLPGIIGLFQSAVAMLSTSSASSSGSNIFSAIAGFFGVSSGTMDYEAAVAATGIFHSGGVVGQPPETRSVASSLFAGAPRYHTGGIVGKAADKVSADLKQDEVPAILMGGPKGKREEVLTADDPRHRDNLGMTVIARIMQGALPKQEAGRDGEDGKPGHSTVSTILQSIAGSKDEGDSSASVLAGLLDRLGVKDGEGSAADVLKVRGARELGGPVSARSMYRVNEKGPELLQVAGKQYLMTGAQGGKVLPHEGGQKEERPVVVNNNFALAGPTSQASQGQIAAMATRGVKRGMRNT